MEFYLPRAQERHFVKAKYGNCARNFILSSDASILNIKRENVMPLCVIKTLMNVLRENATASTIYTKTIIFIISEDVSVHFSLLHQNI